MPLLKRIVRHDLEGTWIPDISFESPGMPRGKGPIYATSQASLLRLSYDMESQDFYVRRKSRDKLDIWSRRTQCARS